MFIWLLLLNLVQANVFPPDERVNFHEITDPKIKELAEGSVAIVPKERVTLLPDGRYELSSKTLAATFNMCADTPFSSEPLIANCSGALVEKDVILTAGHCVNKNEAGRGLKDYYAVFNYRKTSANQTRYIVGANDVFALKEFVYYEFVGAYGVDLTLIRLEKPAPHRVLKYKRTVTPVGTPLFILGYPLGTPLKFVDGSPVIAHNSKEKAFKHELDTFSVNSGSPVFNALTNEIIGVHVRGTGMNTSRYGRTCDEWRIGESGKDWEEANDLTPLPY